MNEISVDLLDAGINVDNFTSYTFTHDFLSPCATFDLEIADARADALAPQFQCGARVALRINNTIQASGYIDRVFPEISRSGTVLHIQGRDALSRACGSSLDPKIHFTQRDTLSSIMRRIFERHGFTSFEIDDAANRNIITGQNRAPKAKPSRRGKALRNFINHQLKPYPGEGEYEFASRVAKRFGLHLWASADGRTLYVSEPTFDSPALYNLVYSRNPVPSTIGQGVSSKSNNVLSASGGFDWTNQPSVIIAEGVGGGGEFRKQTNKVVMVNEILSETDSLPSVAAILKAYPEAKRIPRRDYFKRPSRILTSAAALPHFCTDDESKTLDQLENFVYRKMAEFQHQFLKITYSVQGHVYEPTGAIWAPNTIVNVYDEARSLNQDMWIKSRTFTKSRNDGTKTRLEVVLPHTLEF
jgi:prophage tail gpP-like protein